MLYEKILVPMDGSNPSINALKEATRISKAAGGKVTAAFVCSEVLEESSFVMPKISLGCDEKSVSGQAKKIADAAGAPVDFVMLEGKVAESIVKFAEAGCYDLIVIGARGMGTLSGLLLGSVSQVVIKEAGCPVLVTH
jgi:nucleotide-binding universal stress UspA family protein